MQIFKGTARIRCVNLCLDETQLCSNRVHSTCLRAALANRHTSFARRCCSLHPEALAALQHAASQITDASSVRSPPFLLDLPHARCWWLTNYVLAYRYVSHASICGPACASALTPPFVRVRTPCRARSRAHTHASVFRASSTTTSRLCAHPVEHAAGARTHRYAFAGVYAGGLGL